MAPISKSLALAGACFALSGLAAPVSKRKLVVNTVTNIVWTTVQVTITVDPGQPATTFPVAVTTPAAIHPESALVLAQSLQQQQSEPAVIPTTQPVQTPNPQHISVISQATPQAPRAPQPTPEPVGRSTPSVAAVRPTTAATGGGGGGDGGACSEGSPCDGMITFYDTATTSANPSSCGTTNDGVSENVLALPVGIMKDGDCGRSVTIHYNGQTATGKVVDKCMRCDNTSIDLSRHLFGQLASMDSGRVSGAKWFIH